MGTDMFSKKPPANTADGVVTRIFRKIIQKDVGQVAAIRLLNRYVAETETTKAGMSKCRNNYLNHMKNNKMTFKIFIDILSKIFKVRKLEFTVTIFYNNNKVTSHSETLVLNEKEDK